MSDPARQITFTCCIEHGVLESQTPLMLSTLRANGGRLADARVLVVVPRRGAPLGAATLQALRELKVEIVRDTAHNPAPWFNFSNKLVAVRAAERMATTPLAAWLDSDILIAREPTGLLLADDEDLGARAEYLVPAVYEGVAEHVPYWTEVCKLIGITLEQLPYIDLDHPRVRIRRYFNAGMYVWRRGLGFPDAYIVDFMKLLRSRLCPHDGNIYMVEQVLLGAVAARLGMRVKHLAYVDHHMTFQGQIDGVSASPPMNDSALIHYSKSLHEPHRAKFLDRLHSELPHVHRAVVEAPERPASLRSQRVAELLYRGSRTLRLRLYAKSARPAPRGG